MLMTPDGFWQNKVMVNLTPKHSTVVDPLVPLSAMCGECCKPGLLEISKWACEDLIDKGTVIGTHCSFGVKEKKEEGVTHLFTIARSLSLDLPACGREHLTKSVPKHGSN